jgi:hypothetical protein
VGGLLGPGDCDCCRCCRGEEGSCSWSGGPGELGGERACEVAGHELPTAGPLPAISNIVSKNMVQ